MKIRVLNTCDRETVTYPLPLLSGDIEGYNQDGRLLVSSSGDPDGVIDWPIVDGCFKVLIRLQPGENIINLQWEHESLTLRLTYDLPGFDHVVKPVYIVCADDDGYFQGPQNTDCSSESAARRIALGSEVIQTLTAEKMKEQGFHPRSDGGGGVTFQLDTGDDHRAVCKIFRSQLRLEEAYSMNGYELWNYFGKELMTSPLFSQKSRTKFYCFMSFTRYHLPEDASIPKTHSEILKYTRGHTALGGGNLALFGTGNLHTWADHLSNFNPCLTNRTKMDRKKLMDDSAYREYYWANYATGLGASLHELGHTFDLAHTPTGIMARGFDDLHKVFTVQKRRKSRHHHRHHKRGGGGHQARDRYSSTGSSASSDRSLSTSSNTSNSSMDNEATPPSSSYLSSASSNNMGSSNNSNNSDSYGSSGYHNHNYNTKTIGNSNHNNSNSSNTNINVSNSSRNNNRNNNTNTNNSNRERSSSSSSRSNAVSIPVRKTSNNSTSGAGGMTSPALQKRKTDVCYGSPFKQSSLSSGVLSSSESGSASLSSSPNKLTSASSSSSDQNSFSPRHSPNPSTHHHHQRTTTNNSNNDSSRSQNHHHHSNPNQSATSFPSQPPPLVVSVVEAGFKTSSAGSGALTFSVKNYDGSETRQTILEGQTVSETTFNSDGRVVNKGSKASERRPSSTSIASAASSSSSISSTPSTLPNSPEEPPPSLISKVTSERPEVKYADSAHWFRSSAVVLRFHKWFNKLQGQENGKNPTLHGPCIKSPVGLRLVELRTDPEGTVFNHWEFLGDSPPSEFLLQRSEVINGSTAMPPEGSIIIVMAEDSNGFIMKKKFKVDNFV